MPPKPILVSLRNAFLSGVVLLAPLGVTLLVFSWLLERIGGSFRRQFFFFLPDTIVESDSLQIFWNLLATILVLSLITALGYLSRYFFAKYLLHAAENVLRSVPIVNAVYNTAKQIVDTFSSQKRAIFSEVVLIQFPRAGCYALGFLTNRVQGEPQAKTSEELWCVFVPTTPNPTSGFLVMLPRTDIIRLDMSVGEGMKLIISGGAVVPVWDEEKQRMVATPFSEIPPQEPARL
jgi:uncharacterized membrane protein